MIIHSLKLSLLEQDLNELIRKHMPADQPIEDLKIQLSPQGLVITGVYPMFINVRFETQWSLGLEAGKITAKLDQLKAMGVPGNIFKSAISKMIEDVAKSEEWIQFQGDQLIVDLDAGLAKYAFVTKTNFKVLECRPGLIYLEGNEFV